MTAVMPHSILVEVDLPKDWSTFRLPPALHDRLQELLDRQDEEGRLSARERKEAEALAQLVDMLSLMKLRAKQATR
jgi:hypothetical protein